MAAHKKVDYERIEPAWRAGLQSPAQLAAAYEKDTGVSVSGHAIVKHFKKLDIPRDLGAKILPDWQRIEADYRAGVKTLRQIADENNVAYEAINKRARCNRWARDIELKSKSAQRLVIPCKDEFSTAGFLYVIYIDSGVKQFYKIGMAKHFDSRFDQHQCASPFDICVALCYFTGNMRREERSLHARFADKHVRGEWFDLNANDLSEISKRALLV